MKKIILLFGFACLQMAISLAQTPDGFNYQGVTRNSTGTILLNQAISLRMSILQGSASGTTVYCETHAATSNDYGVFDLVVGNGAVISGNFSTIDWGADIYFMKVEMDGTGGTNYEFMGTSQLLSVPYALHAKTAENVTGTITESDPVFTAWDKTTGISITENQVSDLQNYLTAEVDGSVTNELQVLSISDDTIYLSNGGFVKLPAGFDGQYSSLTGAPSLATVATSGSYNDLNDQPAIPANVSELNNDTGYLITEVDGSVTNELQALSISNDTIYLSNGGFVKLPAGFSGNYNDLTNKPDFTGWDTNDANDFNGDYNNLTNTPTIPANVSQLTNDAGYITGFTEVDGSVTNELQALSISNDTVYLSNGGFVKLPAGFSGNYNDLSDKPDLSGYLTQEADTMLWKKNGNDIFYNTGNVGIGQEDTYGSKLTVVHNDSNWVARLYNSSTFGKNYGLYIAAGTNFLDSPFAVHSSDGQSPFFQISGNGNVGIGTTDPDRQLSIYKVGVADAIGIGIHNDGTNGRKYGILVTGGEHGYGDGKLLFYDESSGQPRITIDNIDNVGIGTTSPVSTLHVLGNGNGKISVQRSVDAAMAAFAIIDTIGGEKWGIGISANERKLRIFENGNSDNARLTIDEGGNVGIGTTNPSDRLTITGGGITTDQGHFRPRNSNTALEIGLASDGTDGIYFQTNNCGNPDFSYVDRMVIKQNGNVGIGGSPSAKLTVEGGDVYVSDIGNGVIIRSPDGTCYRVTVANGGGLVTTAVACP